MKISSEKVLVVAQGLERERILAATCYHSPTELIILKNANDIEALRGPIEDTLIQIQSDLGTKSPDGIPLFPLLQKIDLNESCDFFNLTECVAKIDSLIRTIKETGAKVVVDVSSGPKIVGIAMYIAALLNNVPVTYFIAGKYADPTHLARIKESADSKNLPEQYAYSVKRAQVVPLLPLVWKKIPFDTLKRLDSVGGHTESVTALTDNQDKGQIVSVSRHLRVLEALGYVMRVGKGYKITSDGKDLLKLEEAEKYY